jgi:hypothetical protein
MGDFVHGRLQVTSNDVIYGTSVNALAYAFLVSDSTSDKTPGDASPAVRGKEDESGECKEGSGAP